MNAYASLFDFDKNYKHITKRMKMIVTYDVDSEYDSMLAQQGVYIYHVGNDKSGCYRCGAFKTHALPVGNPNTSSFISHTHDYREIKVCGLCEGYINRLNPKEGTDHVCTNCDEIIYSAGNFVDDDTGVRLCNICRNILEAGIRPLGMSCNVCRMEANRSYDGQFKMVQEDDDKLFEALSSCGVLCSVCGGEQVTRYLINESGHTYIYCNDCYRGSEKCSICGKRRKYDRFDNYDDNLRCIDGCDDIYYEDGS